MISFNSIIQATENADHSFTDANMHVVWAKGQEQGNYIHWPATGIETVATTSDKLFYKPDELKYHGHRTQRGSATVNFLGKYYCNYIHGVSCNFNIIIIEQEI